MHVSSRIIGLRALTMLLVGVLGIENAHAEYFNFAVALVGQTAPATGGGVYFATPGHPPAIDASGNVFFNSHVDNGSCCPAGIFVNSQGTHSAIALGGEPAPVPGGGIYSRFRGRLSANDAGDVAFYAGLAPGAVHPATDGIFARIGGTVVPVVLDGDQAIGTGGGAFRQTGPNPNFRNPSINSVGDVAFFSQVSGGTTDQGIFVASNGSNSAVVLAGDTAPDTGGGTFYDFGPPVMNASGDIAFFAEIWGGTADRGIFIASGGATTALVVQGDTVPGPDDDIFGFLWKEVRINTSGEVLFLASTYTSSGENDHGYFVAVNDEISELFGPGGPAPGIPGGTLSGLGLGPGFNDSGDVVFEAAVTGGSIYKGIFVVSGGRIEPIALQFEQAPGTNGGTYTGFNPGFAAINAFGEVIYQASLTGGSALATSLFGATPLVRVDIDIKPGGDPNTINLRSKGVVRVAILGSGTFDVANVDVTMLAFGPEAVAPLHRKGGHFADVNRDGLTDLVSHYRIKETGIAFGQEEACVAGETLDGSPFEGCDDIAGSRQPRLDQSGQ